MNWLILLSCSLSGSNVSTCCVFSEAEGYVILLELVPGWLLCVGGLPGISEKCEGMDGL